MSDKFFSCKTFSPETDSRWVTQELHPQNKKSDTTTHLHIKQALYIKEI